MARHGRGFPQSTRLRHAVPADVPFPPRVHVTIAKRHGLGFPQSTRLRDPIPADVLPGSRLPRLRVTIAPRRIGHREHTSFRSPSGGVPAAERNPSFALIVFRQTFAEITARSTSAGATRRSSAAEITERSTGADIDYG